MSRLKPEVQQEQRLAVAKSLLKGSPLFDITEYGRSVHAEMEALLSCARTGASPRQGTLYTTTFPCHNCARHIIAAGIKRVVYVEPYPKSQAGRLHSDAILIEEREDSNAPRPGKFKVRFEPFVGIGPRRYFDLFSMRLSTGYPVDRKSETDGAVQQWNRGCARLRVPMLPTSYLDRELIAKSEIAKTMQRLESNSNEENVPMPGN
jgi:deoxycytidylate deaminase